MDELGQRRSHDTLRIAVFQGKRSFLDHIDDPLIDQDATAASYAAKVEEGLQLSFPGSRVTFIYDPDDDQAGMRVVHNVLDEDGRMDKGTTGEIVDAIDDIYIFSAFHVYPSTEGGAR